MGRERLNGNCIPNVNSTLSHARIDVILDMKIRPCKDINTEVRDDETRERQLLCSSFEGHVNLTLDGQFRFSINLHGFMRSWVNA